ncbi:hypothetical protein [Promicromonospora kroppenstedtii]|uniref:hypothetical protein n=1 Tax=Promicromonospora kroppenstedtii TaxID=440482 RepID=UPI0004B69975|nr:hypothetical protein [Promicromonospora kroppenstedtii]
MVRPAPRATRARGALAAAALLLVVLAGCSADGEDPAADGGTGATQSGGATATADDRDAPLDVNEACAAMYVKGDKTLEERIGTALVGASDGLDAAAADQMHAIAVELGRLESHVPEEFQGPVQKVRVPFLQLQKSLDDGTQEQIELDVASTVEGLKEYQALC